MHGPRKAGLVWLVLGIVIASCARPDSPAAPDAASGAPATTPKRLVIAIMGDPPHLSSRITTASSVAGMHEVDQIVHAGLTNIDNRGKRVAQLAEDVPTSENGQWRVFADGRMETTWKIRPNSKWHDGAPFLADDLIFTATLGRDTELAGRDALYALVENIEAPDPLTFRVTWSRPFISADTMLTREISRPYHLPMPKHILESAYAADKLKTLELRYWTDEFVGLGPFRLREFVRGSHFLFDANDQYVLGRPKIDTIEVRFIPDGNTVVANVLAGTVEFAMGRGLSLEQGLTVRDQWKDGKPLISFTSYFWMWPQFNNPNPAVVSDVRFRRALLHALHRQEMVDSIMRGQSSISHAILDPDDLDYKAVESRVVKYDYDPTLAIQMITGLGYARGADGMFRDSANRPLSMEVRSLPTETDTRILFIAADFWKRAGIAIEPVVIPQQQTEDREYRAKFPTFSIQRGGYGPAQIPRYGTAQSPTAENRYSGPQLSGYSNAEFDALLARFQATIPTRERVQVFGDIVNHMTENVITLPLFYEVSTHLVTNRASNILPNHKDSTIAWNSHLWDLR